MRTFYRLTLPLLIAAWVVLELATPHPPVLAQDGNLMDGKPVVCDSTLALLLLVAEHDYGYLSDMPALPNIDLGQYAPLIHQIIALKQTMEPSPEEMAALRSEAAGNR